MGLCSTPSAPPPPDYAAAATAQGVANVDAARAQGRINNPNVVGPHGTQTVTWDGDTPTLTQTLSPEQQAILNAQQGNELGMQGIAGQGIESLRGIIGQGVDFSGMPGMGSAYGGARGGDVLDYSRLPGMREAFTMPGDLPDMPQSNEALRGRVIDAMMGRANEQFGQREDQTNSDLVARGIRPGTEAYAREMERIDQARNDARQQAELGADDMVANAYGMDMSTRRQAVDEAMRGSELGFNQQADIFGNALAAQGQRFGQQGQNAELGMRGQNQQFSQRDALRRQAITEMLAGRQIPLNEITALMSGAQVNSPFSTPGFAQNTSVAPAPIFGAAQATDAAAMGRYNASNAGRNNMMSGLFGLGSSIIGGW